MSSITNGVPNYATWNREQQFESLRLRGSIYNTWIVNVIDDPLAPNLLTISQLKNTTKFLDTSPISYLTPIAKEIADDYARTNKYERFAGYTWTVVNAHATDLVTIAPNFGVIMFNDVPQITIGPMASKDLFVSISDDLETITIYDLAGAQNIGPRGLRGIQGPPGNNGANGGTGGTGPTGPDGQAANTQPVTGTIWIPPQKTIVINQPPYTNLGPGVSPQNNTTLAVNTMATSPTVPTGVATPIYSGLPTFDPTSYLGNIATQFPTGIQVQKLIEVNAGAPFFGNTDFSSFAFIVDAGDFVTRGTSNGTGPIPPNTGVSINSIVFYMDTYVGTTPITPINVPISAFFLVQNVVYFTPGTGVAIPQSVPITSFTSSYTLQPLSTNYQVASGATTQPPGVYGVQQNGNFTLNFSPPLQLAANNSNFYRLHAVFQIGGAIPLGTPFDGFVSFGHRGTLLNVDYQYTS